MTAPNMPQREAFCAVGCWSASDGHVKNPLLADESQRQEDEGPRGNASDSIERSTRHHTVLAPQQSGLLPPAASPTTFWHAGWLPGLGSTQAGDSTGPAVIHAPLCHRQAHSEFVSNVSIRHTVSRSQIRGRMRYQ